jgi:glycosyltransferase involved in cell wall biosynthesis
VTGFLVKPDAPAMAQALQELIGDVALREKFGDAGKIHADRYFSLGKSLADHGALYDFSQHQ